MTDKTKRGPRREAARANEHGSTELLRPNHSSAESGEQPNSSVHEPLPLKVLLIARCGDVALVEVNGLRMVWNVCALKWLHVQGHARFICGHYSEAVVQ